ncbi:MAG: hypothetical protein ABWW65_04570 [Thermoprotei archaeon]
MKILARVPLHVSGIWIPVEKSSLRHTGSLGAGLNLEIYLEASPLTTRECSIVLNNEKILVDHASYMCSKTSISIGITAYSPIGLGVGYGVSAASLLALALIMSKYANRDSLLEHVVLAHEAEVKYRTGLGDVIAEYYGGAEIRVKPGPPGIGAIEQIKYKEPVRILACILGSSESTPVMLSRVKREIYDYGYKLYRELLENPVLEVFFEKAQLFTRRIFDYTQIDELLSHSSGVNGYYRKKQALIVWVENDYLYDIFEKLKESGIKCFITSIDKSGARIVHTP